MNKNMKVYNSLTNKKEELHDNSTPVTMYSCGPTVYYYPHIGNMRAYLFMDFLRKSLHYLGYETNSVLNLTDVGHLTSDEDDGDDKMEVSAKREKKSPSQIANYYTKCFFDDFEMLNIEKPEHIVKATEHIKQMIDFIKVLEEKGFTYRIDDGIYFDVQKFKNYGALSNKDLNKTGVNRIEENSQKHHAFDFALWKFVPKEHIMKWDSPWGIGCPGWHIECSAMGMYYLGNKIDIHTGGVDHKTVHHENEIAQNDCMLGKRVVDKWMHVEFLQVDGGKMGKSLGNLYTVNDLKQKGYSPLDFRYLNLLTHYRKSLNFTFDALNSAKSALKSLKMLLLEHKKSNKCTDAQVLANTKNDFEKAIADDLNMSLAVAVLWKLVRENEKSVDIYNLALDFDRVLSLDLSKEDCIPEEVEQLAKKRLAARQNKDFALSDILRSQIADLGYQINDKKDGYEIVKL